MTSREPTGATSILTSTFALFVATALSVVFYPELAIRIDEIVGGAGGSGSSLGYFRSFYVLPGALAFLLVTGVALSFAARRGQRAFLATNAAAWVVLLVGLVGSVEWYYRSVRAASELR